MIEMKMDCREYLEPLAKFLDISPTIILDRYLEIKGLEPERWGGGTVEPAVAEMLYIIVSAWYPYGIFEIGTNLGYSTWFLAQGVKKMRDTGMFTSFTSIDIDPEMVEIATEKNKNLPVNIVCASSQDKYTEKWLQNHKPDFIFLDSSHEYEQTLYELNLIKKFCPHSILGLHDIFSDGVMKALENFKSGYIKYLVFDTQPNTGFGLIRF